MASSDLPPAGPVPRKRRALERAMPRRPVLAGGARRTAAPDDACRSTHRHRIRRYVMRNDTRGADHAVGPNGYPLQHDDTLTQPDEVSDLNRRGTDARIFDDWIAGIRPVVVVIADVHKGRHQNSTADAH